MKKGLIENKEKVGREEGLKWGGGGGGRGVGLGEEEEIKSWIGIEDYLLSSPLP